MRLHWHRAKDRTAAGVHEYQTCRCGARRTIKTGTGYSGLRAGWPPAGRRWRPGGVPIIYGRTMETSREVWRFPEVQANLLETGYEMAERQAREDGYEPTGYRAFFHYFSTYEPDPHDPQMHYRLPCTEEEAKTVVLFVEIAAVKP